jgi:hypothetical protein
VQLDPIAVGIGEPALIAVVLSELDLPHLDTLCLQVRSRRLDVVYLQAEMPVGTALRFLVVPLEELDEAAAADVQVAAMADALVVDEVEGVGEAQLVRLEVEGSVQVFDGEADVGECGYH